jgi:hypothetical protein
MSSSSNKVRIHRPKLTEYQRAFLYNKERFTVTEAATKVGKTLSHSWWLFELAHAPPEQGDEYLWLAPTYAQACMVFDDVVRKVAPTGAYAINRSDLTITTPKSGILRYKTAEKPDNLYGPSNIRAIVGDEFTRWRPSVWPVVRSLATARQCPVKLIGNYIGEDNWGHRMAIAHANDAEWAYHKITAYDAVRAGIMKEAEVESARGSLPPSVFAALYLCEGTSDPSMLMDWACINDIFTNDHVAKGAKALTCDVARYGSDKTVLMLWSGLRVEHIYVYQGQATNETAAAILQTAQQEGVQRSRIVVDDDGIGGGVVDLIRGCVPFNGGSRPHKDENYANLKAQCCYMLAQRVNAGEVYVSGEDYRDTIAQELSWVKRHKMDHDGKLYILPKDKVKEGLGRSPDFGDNLMMRMRLELSPTMATFERSLDREAQRGREELSRQFRDELEERYPRTGYGE